MSNTRIVCPVNCKYCMASKINKRSEYWLAGDKIGMNKSCVFVNRFPDDPALKDMDIIPWDLFNGEYLGFQGITDCFWNKYLDDLKWLAGYIPQSSIKKLVLISKIPVTDEQISILKKLQDRVVVIYSITGTDTLENTTTASRLESIRKLKENGIDVLPIVHPYIHGYSDLSSFKFLKKIGIKYVSWKGFRYNPENMSELSKYIPQNILDMYSGQNEDEILIGSDYIQTEAEKYGLTYIDLKKYIQKPNSVKGISKEEAEKEVRELAKHVVFSTSNKSTEDVIEYAINRRL